MKQIFITRLTKCGNKLVTYEWKQWPADKIHRLVNRVAPQNACPFLIICTIQGQAPCELVLPPTIRSKFVKHCFNTKKIKTLRNYKPPLLKQLLDWTEESSINARDERRIESLTGLLNVADFAVAFWRVASWRVGAFLPQLGCGHLTETNSGFGQFSTRLNGLFFTPVITANLPL